MKDIAIDRLMSKFCKSKTFLATVLLLFFSSPLAAQGATGFREGKVAFYRGDYERAESIVQTFLKTHPEAVAGWILLARTRIATGQFEQALGNLELALKLAPTNTDALYYLARVSGMLSQIEFQRLCAQDPNSFRVHQIMGESYEVRHDLTKAEKEYKAALKMSPRSVEVLDALGDLERRRYDFDRAVEYYRRATEIQPHDYTGLYGLGAAYLYKQDPHMAAEFLLRALAAAPNSAAAHLALGDAYLRMKDYTSAARELTTATSIEPQMRQAYTLLARVYRGLGRLKDAQDALKKSQTLSERQIEAGERQLNGQELILKEDVLGSKKTSPSKH